MLLQQNIWKLHILVHKMHHLSHTNQLHVPCVTAGPFHIFMSLSLSENLSACFGPCVVPNDLWRHILVVNYKIFPLQMLSSTHFTQWFVYNKRIF